MINHLISNESKYFTFSAKLSFRAKYKMMAVITSMNYKVSLYYFSSIISKAGKLVSSKNSSDAPPPVEI